MQQRPLHASCRGFWSASDVAEGTIARRDGLREVEAEDMDTLLAKVPEEYQLLSVRAV